MKRLKKIISALLAGTAIFSLAGCSAFSGGNIAQTINNTVTMPGQYSIRYEIESESGAISTVEKSKDSDGNIYFKSGSEELLFIKKGEHYILHEKGMDDKFAAADEDAVYNSTYVDSVTAEFLTYAERSKDQFIPGMSSNGKAEKLGRTCSVYSVTIGTENTAVTYSFYVDDETGICLGWDEAKKIAGHELGANGEVFACVEFVTEDVPSLAALVQKESAN